MADDPTKLVQQARAGDLTAWDGLFQRYQRPLYTYVFELVRHEQESLDIVQETFLGAIRHVGSLREDKKFAGWIFGIAHQKCAQHWRRSASRPSVAPLETDVSEDEPGGRELADEADDPGAWLLRQEQAEEFYARLEKLDPAHRAVLLLHFIEDFRLEQIAEITGVPLGTVKSRLHYAKQSLRKLWSKVPL